jgi:putative transposase
MKHRRILFQLMDVLLSLVRTLFAAKADLAMENLALRQQLAVLHRKNPRPRLNDLDRVFWAALKGQLSTWSDALIIVKPDTVVRWHRDAFRRYWARLSASRRPGRPRVTAEVRALIRAMATDNPTWGAPRIHAELLKLDFDIAEVTVSRYMPKRPLDPDKIARWKAFLKNHMPETAAMDFVTIPTATFRLLHCFFIIHHDRRRILHFAVTTNPTVAWVRQQLREVFLDDPRIRYLVHDRDTRFSGIGEWMSRSVRTDHSSRP